MDNTLFDFVGAQIAACHAVVQQLGQQDEEELYSYFLTGNHGFESYENIHDFMKNYGIYHEKNYKNACRIYDEEKLRHITPYPGVIETLQMIRDRGLPMGIVTDAHSRDATRRLEKTGLLPFFSKIITYDMIKVKKPATAPFLFALEMMKAGADETLLIGDSPQRDIEPCRNLGIRTVYARYGNRFSDNCSDVQADFIIDAMAELPGILCNISVKH